MPRLYHHGNDLVKGYAMAAIGGAGVTSAGESLGGGKDIAFDAGNLHHAIDRITGQTQVMLQSHFRSIFHLAWGAPQDLCCRSCRT